jgi:hypothetical protein
LELVANTIKGSGPSSSKNQWKKGGKSDYTKEVAENQPYKLHNSDKQKVNHLLKGCFFLKERTTIKKGERDKNTDDEEDYQEDKGTFVIFTTVDKKEEIRIDWSTVPATTN